MSDLAYLILFSLGGGLLSLGGGFLILARKGQLTSLVDYAQPFAAGTLLTAAFIDLLSEAAHVGDIELALRFTLAGILGFFLLERFLGWFHHHHEHDSESKGRSDSKVILIVVGDTLHNFIDGIAIAAGFLIDVPTGIIVTIAVNAHELPQEIGDFSLLLKKGMSRKNVLITNVLSASVATVSAVSFYVLGNSFELNLSPMLGLVAGFFIYIAVSDIIPSIHQTENRSMAMRQSLMLFAGVLVMSIITTAAHNIIDQEHEHTPKGIINREERADDEPKEHHHEPASVE